MLSYIDSETTNFVQISLITWLHPTCICKIYHVYDINGMSREFILRISLIPRNDITVCTRPSASKC